ncbi:MAG: Rpp14/Pop5 family protein, partial [Methanothrix sp.]
MIFELQAEDEISPKDLMNEINSSQYSLFGDEGAAKNHLKMIAFNGRYGLIRFSHIHIQETRATLATIHSIHGVRVALHTKGVCGTIKSATEKYLPRLSKIC